jgi:Zn-dependent protease/predicted transcriptional regulator
VLEKRLKLFKLLGFEVGIDLSWVFIAILIAWSLSTGFFPFHYEDLDTQTYWIMGIIGAVGLFISIIFHEFSHSVTARRYGMEMKGITLFIFGGVAEMPDEPPTPKAEFMMAIMGPIASILLGVLFYLLYQLGNQLGWRDPVNGVIQYLSTINFILAIFNMLPAFPLDGGRVLRSILWRVKQNLKWATRVSSQIGSGFGILLIILSIVQILNNNFIGGMWWFLIGMFLRNAAKSSYQQLLTKKALGGHTVERFMKTDPVTVTPEISLRDLVEDYVYRHHFKMFPVVQDSDQLAGCVTTREVKQKPKERWDEINVGDLTNPCSSENTVTPETDAVQALSLMNKTGSTRLMVTRGDRLVGVITLKDMLDYLTLKIDLEDAA